MLRKWFKVRISYNTYKKNNMVEKNTYGHFIQVYLIILHKYSSGNLYWPSLFSVSTQIHKENEACTEKRTCTYTLSWGGGNKLHSSHTIRRHFTNAVGLENIFEIRFDSK